MTTPYIFDEFFGSGKQESISPFLTQNSRKWAKNLSLKSAISASFFLLAAFISSFYIPTLSHLFLLFVYFLSGTPALLNSIDDIKNLEINIDVLMTLAAFLSFLIGSQIEGGLLLVLFALSGAMETHVTKKATGALIQLHTLAPPVAILVASDGSLQEKSVREIEVGEKLLVKAGETVPLDGTIIAGSSFVNLFHITGESIPISKRPGEEVVAGSRNLDGTLTIAVTRTSQDSTLSKITTMITEAQEKKPKLQRLFDRFGKRYAMTIIALFFLFTFMLPLFFSIPFLGKEGSIYRALAFLIAASPCALIIATPTAYLSAISVCARMGILLKGGTTLDGFASCKAIAFDKTGTLTTGKLRCTNARYITKRDAALPIEKAIGIAATLERHSTHPMAEAICKYATEKKIPLVEVERFQSIPGFGVKGDITIKGKKQKCVVGNLELINKERPKSAKPLEAIQIDEEEMITFLLVDQMVFAFSFIDALRPQIGQTLDQLKKAGLQLVMLTGDHEKSAAKVAKKLTLDRFYADLRPEHKLDIVSEMAKDKGLAMVGDGINDAPALARSTIGISLGQIGSTTAIDAADIVLLRDELSLLYWLYQKAHHTLRIVKQNLILALGVICIATTPAILGLVPIWAAVLLHEGGTVLVGLNALRLLKK